MTWPGVLLWILILGGLLSRGPLMVYWFSATVIFGGLTMLPLALTGGLNLQAQTVCALLVILKTLADKNSRNEAVQLAIDVRQLGTLALFLVYAGLTSLILPRLFAGDVMVFSLNAAGSESNLAPTSANFSQFVYLSVSGGIVFAFALASKNPNFLRTYFNSVLLAGILLVVCGFVDLVLTSSGHASFLDAFHNAGYNLLSDQSLAGQIRVVGLMPEASVYAEVCCFVLSFLVFNFGLFQQSHRRFVLPLTIIALSVLTFLSTSSTGYIGLGAIAVVQVTRVLMRILFNTARGGIKSSGIVFGLLGLMGFAAACSMLSAAQLAHYETLLNTVLFDKSQSSSFIERSSWTAAGLNAFLSTGGLGVGVGSVRTSNWFVNILASTGIIGVLLLFAFCLKFLLPFRGTRTVAVNRLASGLKLCLIPAAVMIGIAGTTPDPGVWIAAIFGLLCGLSRAPYATRTDLRLDRERFAYEARTAPEIVTEEAGV